MPASTPLTGADRTRLRGLAMRLKPAVFVGKAGVTANVLGELDAALQREQLVKVRLTADEREARAVLIAELERLSRSICIGSPGHTAAFFRPNPQKDSLL